MPVTPSDSIPATGVSQWFLVARRFPLRSERRRACIQLSVATTINMPENSFVPPGHHPLETTARFGRENPVDYHLERLYTFLRWNREHFASFKHHRESDPENAERELGFLDDTIEQGYEHLARLTELLRTGYQPTLDDE